MAGERQMKQFPGFTILPPNFHLFPESASGAPRRLCLSVIALIGFFLGSTTAYCDSIPTSVQGFLHQVDNSFRLIAEQPAGFSKTCETLVSSAMDISEIAKAVAASMVSRPSQAQTVRLKAAVKTRFQRECGDLRSDVGRQPLNILNARQKGAIWIVTTRTATPNGKDRTIVWKLKPGGGWGMLAEDMVVDGRGVIATLLTEMNNRLGGSNGNIDEAIAALAR